MKNLVIYVFIIVTVIFMVMIINKNEETRTPKILTVDTYYSYIDALDDVFYIDFYLSTSIHPLTEINAYLSVMIHDEAFDKSLDLNLFDIIYRHQETYLHETYYKYSYVFDMPALAYDFDILDCYLEISLTNESIYDLYVGSLSLKTVRDDSHHLEWSALSGLKKEGSYLSRLDTITIHYEKIDENISHISLGNLYDVTFQVIEDEIIITIPFKAQLFYACPIIMIFADNETEVFNYFIYINDYEILKQSGQLIYYYALD